ncbi:hypothetical protein D3C80_1327700 [compost metagenome]
MVELIRACIQVIREAQPAEAFHELLMVSSGEFSRRYTFLSSLNCHRCSVTITAGYIQNLVAGRTVVPGQNITGQNACQSAEMQGAVSVRPGSADKNVCHSFFSSC